MFANQRCVQRAASRRAQAFAKVINPLSVLTQIVKIERVQNPFMWVSYTSARRLLEEKYAAGVRTGAVCRSVPASLSPPNAHASPAQKQQQQLGITLPAGVQSNFLALEQTLWHGTGRGQTSPHALCRSAQGWSAGRARDTGLTNGTGTYFAPTPAYPARSFYSVCRRTGDRQLIMADVLLGAQHFASTQC